jgi:nitrite reductase/ring-hydroxylating ferredoxin subunit
MTFQRAATEDDVWMGEMLGVTVGGQRVLLINVDGRIRAYEDRCAHLGTQLSQGRLKDQVLTCSAHEWQYDARTGEGLNPRKACLRAFAVKVEDGVVFVDVEDSRAGVPSP